jgi:hypothetical protein
MGRRGLLAIPMLTAALALALSACGSSAPGGNSGLGGSGTVGQNAASARSSDPTASPAPSGASSAEFCGMWQQFKTTMAVWKTIMDDVPAEGLSTPVSALLPTLQAIDGAFNRMDQVVPAAASTDMDDLTTYWGQVVTAFQSGGTVGQAEAYLKAHPPSNIAAIRTGVQQLVSYLSTTCHIGPGS